MSGLNYWFALLCSLALAGCSAEPAPQDEPTVRNLQEIAQAYSTIINSQEGKPPKALDEIKQTLTHFHAGGLGRDPEVLLRSPRDGQPFVIITGATFDTDGKGTILAYEQQGVDGKRYALMLSRDVLLLSDQDFAKARFAQGQKPDKS